MITVACGAQMSKTEGVFNVMAHRLDEGPYTPVLYIGPTEKLTKSIAGDRWQKVLRTTQSLWKKTAKGQLNKTIEQFIGGVRCGFAWSGSASQLAAHPAGLVMIDERSRMKGDVGGEGDPVSLGRARTKNYIHRKIGVFSTPTLEGGDPTWALLEESTMRFWAWRCIHCSELFVPQLRLLHWPDGATPAEAIMQSRVCCQHCGGEHETSDKDHLNETGEYMPVRVKTDQESQTDAILGKYMPDLMPAPNPNIGFWISGLASPWASFGDIAGVLVEAYRSHNNEKIQAEVNTWGGECFKMEGEAPAWTEVDQNRLHYSRGAIQRGVVFLTLGCDVQKQGLYYVVRGWGANSESWLIDEGYIEGETIFDEVWTKAGELLLSTYGDMRIKRAFFDSGFRPGDVYKRPDHAVYTFCRRFPGLAFPTKGHAGQDKPFRFVNLDYAPGGGIVIKGGVRLCHIDSDYFKSWVHSRVRWPDDEAGGWHLHQDTPEMYCRQIVAEEQILKPSGAVVWVKTSRHNHFLDCEVLAACAAVVEGVDRIRAAPTVPEQSERQNDRAASVSKKTNKFKRSTLF